MPDLGQASPPPIAPGAEAIAALQAARKPDGSPAYSVQDIQKYHDDITQTLLRGGATPQMVEAHWGTQPPHSPQLAAHVAANMQRAGLGGAWDYFKGAAHDVATAVEHPIASVGVVADELKSGVTDIAGAAAHPFKTAEHATAAFEAGWGTGVTGLAIHAAKGDDLNKVASAQPGPDLLDGIAHAAGQGLSDLPASVLGFFGGTVAGAAAGGAAGGVGGAAVPVAGETGVSELAGGGLGAAIGGAAGGGFGAGAAPQAMRETIMDTYNRGELHSFSDVLHVLGASAIRVGKAGLESLPFGAAGAIEGKLAEAGAKPLIAKGGGLAAATAAGTAIGAGLNGQVPDAKDFITSAATMVILAGGVKAGEVVHGVFKPSAATLHAANNLQQIYRRNGTLPWDALNQARTDPGKRQEILQQDVNGDSVAPRLHASAPDEPPPPLKPAEAEAAPPKNPNFDEPTTSPSGRYTHEPTAESKKNTAIYSEYRATPTSEPVKLSLLVDHDTGKTTVNINTAKIENAGDAANTHGPAEVRDILSEVLQAHPGITEITGVRKTGAGGEKEITQSLSRSQVARIRAKLTGEPQQIAPRPAPIATSFEDLSTALEGSRDDQVSPAGAIGKHQIMLGTARQYGYGEGMSQAELAQWLHDPNNNAQVFHSIARDLNARFHGNMNAMLIAYNAGPGRAGEYMKAGPGTELEAIPDRSTRGGIRYERVPSERDESFLPMETQKYLANGRRRSGGATTESAAAGGEGGGRGGLPALRVFPSEDNHAESDEDAYGGGSGGKPPGGDLPGLGGPDEPEGPKFTHDEAVDEIMANIGEPKNGIGWFDLLSPDKLKQQFISELSPARNIDTALVREGQLDRNKDVGHEDMFRQTYASDSRTGVFLRKGIVRIGLNNEMTIDPSASGDMAVNQVHEAGGDMRGWTAWMLAKRTTDKEKQGIKTGFNLDAAKTVADDAADRAKYEQGTETLNKVLTGALEFARDSHYLSQAQVDAMVRDNPVYISMRRIMGDDESFGTGRKGFVPREALRNMEGSDRQIIDPIYATLDNMRVLINMADRNRAIGSIIGQAEGGALKDLGLKMEGEVEPDKSSGTALEPYGLAAKDAKATYGPLLAERSHRSLAPNQFIYYRDGVAERWSTTNPDLAQLIRKSTTPGEVNIIGKVFDTLASLDRAGIVLDPSFPVRTTLRHQITAFIADPLHPTPFITLARGLYDAITEKGVFGEWVANGGAGSALADMDVNWFQRDMERTFQDHGIFGRLWNRVQHPIEAAQWIHERLWAATQIGYYKAAKDAGLSPLKAATMSRKAYLDSAERASLEAVNSLARKVPFLRMKALGTKQFGEAFAERPWQTMAYSGVTVGGIAAALYAANYIYDKNLPDGHDKEKFDAIPRWVKDTHYITPPIAGARVMFPYPFVVGPLLGGLTNRLLDHWKKSDPLTFDAWARGMLSDYNVPEMLPTAIKVPLEAMSNHSYFTGKPIVPASVQAADGYMQYTNATTEPAKALSRYLGPPGLNLANFSPIQAEHWLDGWTGPIGMGVLKAVNGRMTDYQQPSQLADLPIVGTYFVRNPGMSAQQIEDFYTGMKTMEAAHADWALALKHGDEGEIAAAARGPLYGLKMLSKIDAALHVQSAAVANINKDKTVRPEEKSQDVDQVLNSMVQLSIVGSGITAILQHKEPSQAFKELDRSGAWRTAVAQ